MDEVRLNYIGLIGPGIWNMLHAFAIEAKDEEGKNHFEYFVKIMKTRIKCAACIIHLNIFLQKHPLDEYRDIKSDKGTYIGYFKWSYELHNSVNKKLSKMCPTMDAAYKEFINRDSHIGCIACGELY